MSYYRDRYGLEADGVLHLDDVDGDRLCSKPVSSMAVSNSVSANH